MVIIIIISKWWWSTTDTFHTWFPFGMDSGKAAAIVYVLIDKEVPVIFVSRVICDVQQFDINVIFCDLAPVLRSEQLVL
jgi:hypothetical protein